MRMRDPAPVWVPVMTVTPGAREFSTSATDLMGAVSVTSLTLIVDTAFPSSSRAVCPVAVVTTGAMLTATCASANSTVACCPARDLNRLALLRRTRRATHAPARSPLGRSARAACPRSW